jgi:hypothetical protein
MRVAFLVLLCIAATGCRGDPRAKAAMVGARDAYLACTIVQGQSLERSGEPAESVATAAIGVCGQEEAAALEAYRVDARSDALAMEVVRRMRRIAYEGVVADVVQARARRR